MRRMEFLLSSVRRSTDNVQTSAITDAEMIEWFNDGQKLIQNIVFKSNFKADIFKAVEVYDATSEGIYDLPEDIYAINALSLVEATYGLWDPANNYGYVPITRVDESDRAYLAGYFIRDNKLIFTGYQANYQFTKVRLTYFKALPRFDKRWGTIDTVNSGVSLVLSNYDELASSVDDYVTVIDGLGNIIREGILISNFTGGTWSTSDALTGVTAGMFVCMCSPSNNLSGLPNECEPYLLDYVRKRLYGRNVYTGDDAIQEGFTAEQKDELIRLFSNNTKEIISPPLTDLTMLDF